jgi:DNA-binding NarL/FixJ family response regulator
MSSSPRVLIADDHAPTRAGVRMALERGGIEVCAEASSAGGAVEAALRERPDACILDIHMPGGGISAASMITFKLPGTVVLMLTVSRADEDLLESVRRGATGYLLKEMDPAELPEAVRAALRGEATMPGVFVTRLLEEFRQRPQVPKFAGQTPGQPELTSREREILELLREGAGTAEMATRLFLSQVTVRRHLSSGLAKLGVSSRKEAIQLMLAEQASSDNNTRPDGEPS